MSFIEGEVLLVFVLATIVFLLTPGPAVIYIVTRSISQGPMAGFVAALGMHVGTLFHIGAAAYGLSQLLLTSALAFSVVKYLGAAYLVYLGIKSFLSRNDEAAGDRAGRKGLFTVFRESVVVNMLNPKTALFFFAFLPQFVDPAAATPVSNQIVVLGLIFIVVGILSDGLYAFFAGVLRSRLRTTSLRYGRYVTGTAYTGLGIAAALVERDK